jgi:hypothetical protein
MKSQDLIARVEANVFECQQVLPTQNQHRYWLVHPLTSNEPDVGPTIIWASHSVQHLLTSLLEIKFLKSSTTVLTSPTFSI